MHKVCVAVAAAALAWANTAAHPAQQAPSCRTYSADEVRTVSGATFGTVRQRCRFDAATTSRICTIQSRLGASSFELEFTDKYNSVADFVDEIKVIPPVARIQTQTRRYTSGAGTGGRLQYDYDSMRRQTKISSNVGGNLLVTTYSEWDAQGRPQRAVISSAAAPFTLAYKYDNTARTMTITGPAGTQVHKYDADGNLIHEENMDGGGLTVFSVKISQTDKVCKQ